jgi:hypothetical protein
VVFGLLVIAFAYGLWLGKKAGWWETVAVSVFVILADSSAVLNAAIVPGTPKGPAAAEIAYSVILIGYLFMGKVYLFSILFPLFCLSYDS